MPAGTDVSGVTGRWPQAGLAAAAKPPGEQPAQPSFQPQRTRPPRAAQRLHRATRGRALSPGGDPPPPPRGLALCSPAVSPAPTTATHWQREPVAPSHSPCSCDRSQPPSERRKGRGPGRGASGRAAPGRCCWGRQCTGAERTGSLPRGQPLEPRSAGRKAPRGGPPGPQSAEGTGARREAGTEEPRLQHLFLSAAWGCPPAPELLPTAEGEGGRTRTTLRAPDSRCAQGN